MSPTPSLSAAVDFLRWWRAGGPWVLTRITPDKKGFQTRTFREATLDDLRRWLEESFATHNIYFHVNPTTRDLVKKAEREDVKELAWLHVDIDPRAGEHIDAERTRALELLTTRLPPGVPAPSAVVFSGGGYQGFWRLDDPLPINGEPEAYEEAKRYNQALELAFGADHCHNVDRIMRLPGSINWPDARKAKKGRVPTLAEVVSLSDATYPLSAFTPAPRVQLQTPLGFGGASGGVSVEVSGNVPRVADISELDQWGVPDRVKVIIIQGSHPDETKKGDNSRSAWVFDVCCNLHRCGVPDEIIFSILTDPDYAISSSILEKGSNAERYALRQIARAKEHAIDPLLREFNERFAVIGNMGGKCRVIEEVPDPVLGRARLTRQTFDDFRARWMHRYVELPAEEGKVIRVPAGKWWLAHPNRRYYDHLVFSPKSDPPGAYNLWRGYGVTPRPGNEHQAFLDHTLDVICGGSKELYDYIMCWLARLVQHPDQPGEVAIVLRGGMGVGKSRWAEWIATLLGRHALQVTNPGHLVGNFNAHLRDAIFLFADEAFYAGDKKHENILRTIITERTIMIEAKGIDAEQQPNFLHLVMASNSAWVVPAGMDERRYLVLDVSDQKKEDFEYFQRLMEPLKRGGAEALLHHLLSIDLSEFNVRRVPKTEALKEQKLYSMSAEDEWWMGKLEAGALLPQHTGWETEVIAQDLQRDYFEHMRNVGVQRRASPTTLGRFLNRVLPPGYPRSFQRMGKITVDSGNGYELQVTRRLRYYELPPLSEARALFVKRFGFEGDWLDQPLIEDDGKPPDEVPF